MGAGATIAPGTVFAGDYEVERTLAAGGMGAVYVARQRSTQKLRALKTLLPEFVSDAAMRARFAREATVGSQIESDHVVEVLAAGVDEASGVPWIVMELLSGDDLAGVFQKRGPLSPPEVVEAFRQLGHALTAAHRAGVVHRDLKPENLFLATARREGVPFMLKVLDFGIARIVHANATRHTTSAMGSPLWMAPEQTDSTQPITPATDVWALGLIAFWVLTGTHYWFTPRQPEATIGTMIRELLADPLVRASERAAAFGVGERIPPGFDAWFARCVTRDAAQRFPSAGEAIPSLLALLGGTALPATEALPRMAPAPYAATQPGITPPSAPAIVATVPAHLGTLAGPPPVAPYGQPPMAPPPPAPPRSKAPMVVGIALLTAALVGAVGYALRPRDEPTPRVVAATPDAALEPDAPPLGSSPEEPVRDPVTGLPQPAPRTVMQPRRTPDGGIVYVPVPIDAPALIEPPPTVVEPPPTLVEPPPTLVEPPPTLVEPPPTPVEPPPTVVEPPPTPVEPPPSPVEPPPTMVEPPPVLHTPDAAAPTTPPETSADTGCGRHGNCSSCAGERGCGWCHNLNRCVAGHWAHGAAGNQCAGSDWVADRAQCDDRCARADDCSSCTRTSGCGWCHNLNRCVAGHWAHGPSHGACSGGNWVSGADRCDDRCARIRDCAACTRATNCGWCANVGRCVAGHWANGAAHGACGSADWVSSASSCR